MRGPTRPAHQGPKPEPGSQGHDANVRAPQDASGFHPPRGMPGQGWAGANTPNNAPVLRGDMHRDTGCTGEGGSWPLCCLEDLGLGSQRSRPLPQAPAGSDLLLPGHCATPVPGDSLCLSVSLSPPQPQPSLPGQSPLRALATCCPQPDLILMVPLLPIPWPQRLYMFPACLL